MTRQSRSEKPEKGVRQMEIAEQSGKPMGLSVTTSSFDDIPISEILAEMWAIRVFAIDLYLRGCDVWRSDPEKLKPAELENMSLLDRLSGDGRYDFIEKMASYVLSEKKKAAELVGHWYKGDAKEEDFHIPALATFIPELTSKNPETTQKACNALCSVIELAERIDAKVVEFVLGKCVERCHDSGDKGPCDYVYTRDSGKMIQETLAKMKDTVYSVAKDKKVRLAAEIEPGFSYLLNRREYVDVYLQAIEKLDMGEYVGLNLDMGHIFNHQQFLSQRLCSNCYPRSLRAHIPCTL